MGLENKTSFPSVLNKSGFSSNHKGFPQADHNHYAPQALMPLPPVRLRGWWFVFSTYISTFHRKSYFTWTFFYHVPVNLDPGFGASMFIVMTEGLSRSKNADL